MREPAGRPGPCRRGALLAVVWVTVSGASGTSSATQRGAPGVRRRHDLRLRPRTRSPRSRPARSSTPELWVTGTSMTLLTVDAQAHAGPAAHRPARLEARAGRRVRDGVGFRARAHRRASRPTPSSSSRRVPKMFGYYYPDADAVLAEPERAGHRHRRPQPPRADRRDVRHHRHRPAAADRELGRLRDLVAASTTRPAATT